MVCHLSHSGVILLDNDQHGVTNSAVFGGTPSTTARLPLALSFLPGWQAVHDIVEVRRIPVGPSIGLWSLRCQTIQPP